MAAKERGPRSRRSPVRRSAATGEAGVLLWRKTSEQHGQPISAALVQDRTSCGTVLASHNTASPNRCVRLGSDPALRQVMGGLAPMRRRAGAAATSGDRRGDVDRLPVLARARDEGLGPFSGLDVRPWQQTIVRRRGFRRRCVPPVRVPADALLDEEQVWGGRTWVNAQQCFHGAVLAFGAHSPSVTMRPKPRSSAASRSAAGSGSCRQAVLPRRRRVPRLDQPGHDPGLVRVLDLSARHLGPVETRSPVRRSPVDLRGHG